MNRPIKFRAMSLRTKEWVYGYYYPDFTTYPLASHYITDGDGKSVEVDATTRCEFTGLKDKNGKEIYEGDIIGDRKFPFSSRKVEWEEIIDGEMGYTLGWGFEVGDTKEQEVIGNIYENKELLN